MPTRSSIGMRKSCSAFAVRSSRDVQGLRRADIADLDHRLAAAAELVHRPARSAELSRSDGQCAQETAGLDICTDGDSRFDDLVGGMSWMSYPLLHMDGLSHEAAPAAPQVAAAGQPRGHILHDVLEARVLPKIIGPIGRGTLQYAALWKAAQRLTRKPVKFGTILPELLAASVEDSYYRDPVERVWAFSEALNAELHE